ncbi:amidase [Trinickia acidisoli]|uniref:amidase n=1 Tax=Trinickia acidisoli TaxID=2767482 RepID=UPI001A8C05F8|nr:amidase [Trinickia acidisoli]
MTEQYDRYGFDRRVCVHPPLDSGPLRGLRIAVKDVFDIAGHVSGAGNPDFARTAQPATTHAAAVAKLLDAGATIIGKTLCDELAFSITGRNIHYGTPLNTQAPDRLPGGSSSGSAAIVAAGLADAALGTDTSGSVRLPASWCGLYGMRPTWGAIDTTGIVPLAPSFDTVGWFAREPRMLKCLGNVLLPARRHAPRRDAVSGYRLAIASDAFALLDPGVAQSLNFALMLVRDSFDACAEICLSVDSLDAWAQTYRVAQSLEVWAAHGEWYTAQRPRFDSAIEARLRACRELHAEPPASHAATLADVRERIADAVSPSTILCIPSAPGIAPLRDASAETLDLQRARILALTCIAGLGGLPQITLPIARHAKCPIGLSLIGPRGSDRDLLDIAMRLPASSLPHELAWTA